MAPSPRCSPRTTSELLPDFQGAKHTSISRRTMLIQSTAGALGVATGCKHLEAGTANSGKNGRFQIGLVYFAPEEGAELCMKGLFEGLKEQGLEKDRNLEVLSSH